MRLVLLADTHLPRRARDLPAAVWAAVDAADVVVHAGDWVSEDLLDVLAERSRRLVGVLRQQRRTAVCAHGCRWSRGSSWTVVRLGVVHETGPADGPRAQVRRRAPGPGRARVRAQPHPVGHRHAARDAAAQPGFAHGPTPPAVRDLHDGDGGRRAAGRRHAAPPDPAT